MRAYRTTTPQPRHGNARHGGDVTSQCGTATPAVLQALQRSAGNGAVVSLLQRQDDEAAGEQVRSVLRAGGAPLQAGFRARAEQFLGADLSHVRVHTGAAAAESARAVNARAYTSGSNIVFGSGQYDTSSSTGQHRLAHELTHVVQQQRGPVAGTTTADGLKISDPSDRYEREADRLGAAFVAGRSGAGASASLAPTEDDKEGLQRSVRSHRLQAVQRQPGGDDDKGPGSEKSAAKYVLPTAGLWLAYNRSMIHKSMTPYFGWAVGSLSDAAEMFNIGRGLGRSARRSPLTYAPLMLGILGIGAKYFGGRKKR